MQADRHEAMRRIIDKSFVSEGAVQEEETLREHLHDCAECREYLSACARTVSSLAGFSFEVDPELHGKVLVSLALRAKQLETEQPHSRPMLWNCILALLLTGGGSFVVSRFAGPAAAVFHLQPAQVQLGLLAFWVVPSLCLSLLVPFLPMAWTNKKGRMV